MKYYKPQHLVYIDFSKSEKLKNIVWKEDLYFLGFLFRKAGYYDVSGYFPRKIDESIYLKRNNLLYSKWKVKMIYSAGIIREKQFENESDMNRFIQPYIGSMEKDS